MEKLNDVARHSVDGYGRQDICYNDPEGEFVFYSDYKELEKRAEAAEAKLAELESREALGWQFEQCEGESCDNGAVVNVRVADVHLCAECSRDKKYSRMKINALPKRLTRPNPAVDLADLVPDAKEIRKEAGGYAPVYSLQEQQLFIDGATWLSAAILRNIEESGKKHE